MRNFGRMFAISGVLSSFSAVIDEVVVDTADGVLGHFDIEVKVLSHSSGQNLGADNPAIIDAIKKEIAKRGGSRAINVNVEGRETSDVIIARVIGTVVK